MKSTEANFSFFRVVCLLQLRPGQPNVVSDPAGARLPGSLRQALPRRRCCWWCHVCVRWHGGQQRAEWRDVPIPGEVFFFYHSVMINGELIRFLETLPQLRCFAYFLICIVFFHTFFKSFSTRSFLSSFPLFLSKMVSYF